MTRQEQRLGACRVLHGRHSQPAGVQHLFQEDELLILTETVFYRMDCDDISRQCRFPRTPLLCALECVCDRWQSQDPATSLYTAWEEKKGEELGGAERGEVSGRGR